MAPGKGTPLHPTFTVQPFTHFLYLQNFATTEVKVEHVVAAGGDWAGLHELLSGKKLVPGGGVFFNVSDSRESAPWVELLRDGYFSNKTLALTPLSFQTGDLWMQRLHTSKKEHGATWLHYLHLGTCYLERGELTRALEQLKASVALTPNVHALRNLAVSAANSTQAMAYYWKAWSVWVAIDLDADKGAARLGKDLAREFSIWLTASNEWGELRKLLDEIDKVGSKKVRNFILSRDHVLHAHAALLVKGPTPNTTKAKQILSTHCFPTYGHDRALLINLWLECFLMEERAKFGRNLTLLETVHVRRRVGCDGDMSSVDKSSSACHNGPPNLGYPY
jgi:hypothetical protein